MFTLVHTRTFTKFLKILEKKYQADKWLIKKKKKKKGTFTTYYKHKILSSTSMLRNVEGKIYN